MAEDIDKCLDCQRYRNAITKALRLLNIPSSNGMKPIDINSAKRWLESALRLSVAKNTQKEVIDEEVRDQSG